MSKKLLLATLGLLAPFAFAAAGQGMGEDDADCQERQKYREQFQAKRFERLQQVLQLRPDQVEPVQQILAEQREAYRALSREERKDFDFQARHRETIEKLRGVLDEQQLARFEGYTEAMRMTRKHHERRFMNSHGQEPATPKE